MFMAIFEENQLERADWTLLQNGPVNMYWNPEVLEDDCRRLSQLEYVIHRIDCIRWSGLSDALQGLGESLGFPEYYGKNLDALSDCLSDLDVPKDSGMAIVLSRYDSFAEIDMPAAQTILDILADSSRGFMLFGQRLAVMLQSNDPDLRFDPVGATGVGWNRREWPNKSRGL